MDNNIIHSKRKDLKKLFTISWISVAILFLIIIVYSLVAYPDYKTGQSLAVELMLSVSSEFDKYDDYQTLINEMYEFFNVKPQSFRYNGQYFDNSDAVKYAREADEDLAALLGRAGYHCTQGSKYLKYSNYLEYLFGDFGFIICFFVFLPILILMLLQATYLSETKKSLTINGNRVLCKFSDGHEKEYLLDDIMTVDTTILDGVKLTIKTSSPPSRFDFSISFLENVDALRAPIASHISARPKAPKSSPISIVKVMPNATPKTTDEIREYKELLDMGAITQEEFEEKKKQLLGV